jgi:hypothetical protein
MERKINTLYQSLPDLARWQAYLVTTLEFVDNGLGIFGTRDQARAKKMQDFAAAFEWIKILPSDQLERLTDGNRELLESIIEDMSRVDYWDDHDNGPVAESPELEDYR